MNAEPHTHEIKIRRYWSSLQKGCWVVDYGDTSVKVYRGPFFQKRLTSAIRRAIHRHDVGSIRAGQDAERMEKIKAAAIAAAAPAEGGWASR